MIQEIYRGEESSSFGYRLQGLFVHTLLSLGANLIANRASGHPDVDCRYGGKHLKFEVELLSRHRPQWIDPAKVKAIAPEHPGSEGFLALFDTNYPLRWIVINYTTSVRFSDDYVKRNQLEALQQSPFSCDLSDEFIFLVLRNKDRLPNLKFSLLSDWAKRGNVI